MKMSPISAIPHKSKAFRLILDLSCLLRITPQGHVPLVNENIKKTSPGSEIDKIGHVLLHFINIFYE